MVWIVDKVLGSDLDLRGPSLQQAPWLEVRFGEARIRFKNPHATTTLPPQVPEVNADIQEVAEYERTKTGDLVELFFLKGWSFKGRHKRGGVDTSCRILSTEQGKGDDFNFFEKNQLAQPMLRFCHEMWGWQNKSETLGDIGTGLFIYPLKESDLEYKEFNDLSWCSFAAEVQGRPPRVIYATPLDAHHILVIDFTLQAYFHWDFYSPDSNLEEATNKFVEEFMNNFHVELSDEAKAQRAAAKDPV